MSLYLFTMLQFTHNAPVRINLNSFKYNSINRYQKKYNYQMED